MKKPKYFTLKEFNEIYSKVPRLCVEAIIRTKDGVILTKRNMEPASGTWHIPGGTLLMGESLMSGMKRVAKLELGIDIIIEKMLEVTEPKFKNYSKHIVTIVFLAHPKNKNLKFKLDKWADNIGIFKKFPKSTIKYHRDIIKKYKLI